MKEQEVKYASRYIKRKRSNAVGKNLLKTITEPITNSDDSYRILTANSEVGALDEVFPITIYINKKNRLVRIIDNAEGMMAEESNDKFKEYGAAKSGAYKGYSTRGLFGQGISDVLFYHSSGCIKSIKNGEASICKFYQKNDRPFIKVDKQTGPIQNISNKWGIKKLHGTVVEFVLDKDTIIYDYDNLVKKLKTFYTLRLINTNSKRKINLIYIDTKGNKKNAIIKYYFPKGELIEQKDFSISFESYNPVKVEIQLYKSSEFLQGVGDERESGLLIFDDKDTIYDLTFFGLDHLPGTDKFYGFMKLTGVRDIILDKINDKKHPEEVLTDSRDGFNRQHEFCKQLERMIKDWLYPILNEERRKKSNDGLSEYIKENHRKAFEELNKLYSQLTSENLVGTIKDPKGEPKPPVEGMKFAYNKISITKNKRYGLQLIINTEKIKPGSVIELISHKNNIGFTPNKILVENKDRKEDKALIKYITITGKSPQTTDTLEARFGKYNTSVLISVVWEEIFYPEKGLGFYPDYFRSILEKESKLNLYIDLNIIKLGSKIKLISSTDYIKLKYKEIYIEGNQFKRINKIAKLPVFFTGTKKDATGVVKSFYENFSTQARIDIKERIPREPPSFGGKFRDWDFDEKVSAPFQAAYDSIEGSPTQGYILINPQHPINKKYFGENPQKSDIEKSTIAQLYLAELILNESLNVIIPEAIQKGTLSKRSDYDVLYYIVQKKYEYSSSIYSYFVEQKSKNEKQIESISKNALLSDGNLVEGMSGRNKQMVEMRFGLNEHRPHTLEEIGDKFSISRERVRQVINQVLAKKFGAYSYVEDYDYIKEHEKQIEINLQRIIEAVANFYHFKKEELKKRTRKANIVGPRQVAIYLIRSLMGLSFSTIGNIFNLDHTTVLYAFEKITDRVERNQRENDQIKLIKNIINLENKK